MEQDRGIPSSIFVFLKGKHIFVKVGCRYMDDMMLLLCREKNQPAFRVQVRLIAAICSKHA